jgi:hypothetical protein
VATRRKAAAVASEVALARLAGSIPYLGTPLRSDAPARATPAERWGALVRPLGCVVCRRFIPSGDAVELHHVAEGSGLRSEFGRVPLCVEHHRGKLGLHGLSPEVFAERYRVPGESEFGLLIWVAEDIARFRLR